MALVAGIVAYGANRLDIAVGEEGYTPYDPQLAGGSFDQLKWVEVGGSCNGLTGQREASCKAVMSVPYNDVTIRNGKLVHTGLPAADQSGQRTLRTKDLRLIDFRTEFQLYPGGVNGGTICWYDYCFTDTAKRNRASSPVAALELRWDDAELGHYQLFINNQLKREGIVPEGTPFYLESTPTVDVGTENWLIGELTLINPRVKPLFGCDLQAGEVKVHTCTAGPAVVTSSDLVGLKRFCPSLPATFTDAGISASSKRIYYKLAQGKPEVIAQNQIWEFQYIADGKTVKTSPDKTGIVELCKGPVLIEDLEDLPVEPAAVTGSSLSWTSYGRFDGKAYKTRKTDLLSGDKVFMSTSSIKIDDAACPYTEATQSYPGLPASCFSLVAFGKTFHEGDTVAVADGLNVTLQSLAAQYRLDDTAGRVYAWSARWQLQFAPSIVRVDLPELENAMQQTRWSAEADLTSGLPGPALIVTNAQILRQLTGERLTLLSNATVGTRGSARFEVDLPTDTLGRHDVTVWPTLQTEFGGIAFAPVNASYTVTAASVAANGSVIPTVPAGSGELHWWERLWGWLVSLFTYG